MTDRPPFLWALSPSPRPRHGEKSPSTYLQATRELPPIPWALSSSPGVLHDNGGLSTRQDTFTVNVSRNLEGNESQDDGYIELESNSPVSEREENDSGTSNRTFPPETEATRNSRVELVIRKIGTFHKLKAKIRECNRELGRIAAEVTALSKDANSKQDCHLTS